MKILLIEDDLKVARIVATGLEADRYSVDIAHSAREGLAIAEAHQYDLAIIDLMLPDQTGIEVVKRIRTHNQSIPILVLTALDALRDKISSFEAGADDYLTKPFAFAELSIRVKALLRRGAVTRNNTITLSDLEIDCISRQVRRSGKSVKLTAKEFALLEYLALNSSRVLSRTMIMEHVWDESFEGLTNIVDVYVRQLRSKIDDSHDLKLIHTARGMGYYLSDKADL